MSAPHERLTPREQHDRAMSLAGVLMRGHPSERCFTAGPNEATGINVATIDEAGRRAKEMRWPGVEEGLAGLRSLVAEHEAARARFAANKAAERCIDAKVARTIGLDIEDGVECSADIDSNGSYLFVLHWPASIDPWARMGEKVYRRCLEAMIDDGSGFWREQAAFVWDHLNAQQRAVLTS